MGDRRVMPQGLLVSLEGLDGVGKSTQIELLSDWLKGCMGEVLTLREPGGTSFGEAIRDLILHRAEAQSGLAEFLVFAAARAELVETSILPALARGAVVLMDRFIDSSAAYQAFGHGLDVAVIQQVNRLVTQGRSPDVTFWLKGVPFATESADRFEKRDRDYFERVEQGYAWLSEQEPQRWVAVDSRQNPAIIFDTLKTRINLFLDANKKEAEF